jgi:hypothetical protein
MCTFPSGPENAQKYFPILPLPSPGGRAALTGGKLHALRLSFTDRNEIEKTAVEIVAADVQVRQETRDC